MRYVSRVIVCIALFIFGACGSNQQENIPGSACYLPSQGASLGMRVASHIPAQVKGFTDRGAIDDTQSLTVTLAIELRNEDELDQRIAAMYMPGNAGYRKFLTPEEFRDRYAPSSDRIEQVRSFLAAQGLTAVSINANGFLVKAQGSVQALSRAFNTEIHSFRDARGNAYFAPSREPELPQGLGIRAVHGLHNVAKFRSHARPRIEAQDAPAIGTGPMGGLSPSELRSFYQIPSNATGAGQALALVELDGYDPSDIANYENAFGLPEVPLQNVLVAGASGAAGAGAVEVTMDIELMTAIAPGASRILVYEAPNDAQDLLELYSRIADDDLAAQISTSWGADESEADGAFLLTENAIFKQMAAQGQSFYAAAGDAGAYDNGVNLSVNDPASQPYVVAVGGTRLVGATRGNYAGETTWNDGMGASGGGSSSVWSQPTWQSGVANSDNMASQGMRNVPDVSLEADPQSGYSIFVGGQWGIYGGTSAAAPAWAAFTALINQARASRGLGALGFPNPHLYAVGASSRAAVDFHDINDGSTNMYYPAMPGYDDATGWGSFNGRELFKDLSTDAVAPLSVGGC